MSRYVRRRRLATALAGILAATIAAAPANIVHANGWSDRAEEQVRFARLEMQDSDGRTFRPQSFIFSGASDTYIVDAPRNFDAEQATGLPAARLPLVGGWFRQVTAPPPDRRGAPVYAVGDTMALDLAALSPDDLSTAMSAAQQGRAHIITRSRGTVLTIRPRFQFETFSPASRPDFGQDQIGEAFVDGNRLIIAPLHRDFYGTRPW